MEIIMEYKAIQKTAALRNNNGIKAYRILGIEDKHLIFQLWLNSDKQERLMVSMPEEYSVGEYIDLQVIRTGNASYIVKLIGRTPAAFVPDDGRNIAI